jgi:hypothetical protein
MMSDHDHYGEYAEERHRHYDLEREDETAQRDIRRLQEDVRELRAALELAAERISDLDRLRPTCTRCHDATATQQTASGPSCAECAGDPADDDLSEPPKRHTAAGVCWCGDIHAGADTAALYDDQKEEPGPDDYEMGPEVDDEGGMSEYRYVLPEDYGRGQS